MSGSAECAVDCKCAQIRLRFTLLSKEVLGNGVRTYVSSKGKIPSTTLPSWPSG